VPPIVLTALQVLLLVLLYLFVARAVRAVVRDVVLPRSDAGFLPEGARAVPREPVAPAQTLELVVHPPSGRPQVIPLDGEDVTFGRAPTATVVLADQFASDEHARVYLSGSDWYVSDLGSTNGTYVNQRRVTERHALAPGDQISMGKTTVQVRR